MNMTGSVGAEPGEFLRQTLGMRLKKQKATSHSSILN